MERRLRAFDVLIVVSTAAVFVPFAVSRFIDGDEGVYAFVSKLVTHGGIPYRDFAYPQMPLLPYLYGAWMWVAGESWASLRVPSALLAVALGGLIYVHVLRRTGRVAAVIALCLFTASGLVFGWLTTVKSYSLSALLLFGAYTLVERASSRRRILLGGVVLGLGIGTRLLLAGAVPAFVVCLLAAQGLRRSGLVRRGRRGRARAEPGLLRPRTGRVRLRQRRLAERAQPERTDRRPATEASDRGEPVRVRRDGSRGGAPVRAPVRSSGRRDRPCRAPRAPRASARR